MAGQGAIIFQIFLYCLDSALVSGLQIGMLLPLVGSHFYKNLVFLYIQDTKLTWNSLLPELCKHIFFRVLQFLAQIANLCHVNRSSAGVNWGIILFFSPTFFFFLDSMSLF